MSYVNYVLGYMIHTHTHNHTHTHTQTHTHPHAHTQTGMHADIYIFPFLQ